MFSIRLSEERNKIYEVVNAVIGRGDLGNTNFTSQSAEYAKKLKIQDGGQNFTSNPFHKKTS